MFDGDPDEAIPQELQDWAMSRVEEYHYRKLFGLTKEEMSREPYEDVIVNFKIAHLLSKKQESDHAIVEEKAKRGFKT